MPAAKHNILVEQGSTFRKVITMNNVALTGNTPFDFTGYTIRSQLREGYGSTAYWSFSCTYEGGPTSGQFSLAMGATTTASIPASESHFYVYDVEMATGSPEVVTRILEGTVRVTPEVTRT